jgi:isopentenyldiphosphate isomerase
MVDHFKKANSIGEVLDLVDKNDVVLGTVNRQKANKDPKLTHREVSIILVTTDKKVVLQKRSEHKLVHPGWWSIVAGHVPAGEDPNKVALVELEEEFGLTTIPLKFFTKKYLEYAHESHFMYYYVGLYSGEKINFDESEVSEVKIVSLEEIAEMILHKEIVNTKHLPIIKEVLNEK